MASQLISSRPIAPRKLDGETREGVEGGGGGGVELIGIKRTGDLNEQMIKRISCPSPRLPCPFH